MEIMMITTSSFQQKVLTFPTFVLVGNDTKTCFSILWKYYKQKTQVFQTKSNTLSTENN